MLSMYIMTLTTGQIDALDKIYNFLKNKNINNEGGSYVLKGSAGTGKTFTVKHLIEKIANNKDDFEGDFCDYEEYNGYDNLDEYYDIDNVVFEDYKEKDRNDILLTRLKNNTDDSSDNRRTITFLAPTHKALKVLTKSINKLIDPNVYKHFKFSFKTISKFLLKKKVDDIVDGEIVTKFVSEGIDEDTGEIKKIVVDTLRDYEKQIQNLEDKINNCSDNTQKLEKIYLKKDLELYKNTIESSFFDEEKKFYFTSHFGSTVMKNGIYIMDECSMIGDSDYKILKKLINLFSIKILFIGDSSQFAPIVINKDKKKLFSKISKTFRIKDVSMLTETKRIDNKKLYNIYKIFRQIVYEPSINYKSHIYSFLNKKNDYFNVLNSDREFMNEIKKSVLEKEDFCVLSHTNKAVTGYNNKINEMMHPNSTEDWHVGDKIIFYQPYKSSVQLCKGCDVPPRHPKCRYIHNNDLGYIVSVQTLAYSDEDNYFNLTFKKNGDERKEIKVYKLVIKMTDIACPLNKNKDILITVFKVSKKDRPRYLEGLRQVKKGILLLSEQNIKAKTPLTRKQKKEIFEKLNDKKNEIDSPIKRSYAITTMKSQGSTYDKVFIDSKDLDWCKDMPSVDKARNLYTAVTRASKKIFLLAKFTRDDRQGNDLNEDFEKICSRCHNKQILQKFVRSSGESKQTCNRCSAGQKKARLKNKNLES